MPYWRLLTAERDRWRQAEAAGHAADGEHAVAAQAAADDVDDLGLAAMAVQDQQALARPARSHAAADFGQDRDPASRQTGSGCRG